MLRTLLIFALPGLLSTELAIAQVGTGDPHPTFLGERIGTCLFSEDFQGGVIPAGWDIGAPVEQQDDQTGMGLGTFVDAWSVGASPSIGDDGYFVAPELVPGDLFARTNDDADPCNCDLDSVALTTPSIDLTGASNAALFFRAIVNDRFGGGPGIVRTSIDGGQNFFDLDTIASTDRAWKWHSIDLSAFDNEPDVRIRFAWSDSSEWSVGFGIDDVCVFTRNANDLRALEALSVDATADPNDQTIQRGQFSFIPLEQVSPLNTSLVVMNTGFQSMTNVVVTATVLQNGMPMGTFMSSPLAVLDPTTIDTVVVQTGWVATAPGTVVVEMTVSADQADDAPADDMLQVTYTISGPDAVDESNTYARDRGLVERYVSDNAGGMLVGNRFAITASGSSLHGMGVALGEGTSVGAVIQMELRDANLNSIAISDDHVVASSDLNPIGGDHFVYIPFSSPIALDAGADVYAVLRHIAGSSDTVVVGVSGRTTLGDGRLFRNQDLAWNPLVAAPMVKMYLSSAVGIDEPRDNDLFVGAVYPVPASEELMLPLWIEVPGRTSVMITDLLGRTLFYRDLGVLPRGNEPVRLDITSVPSGAYQLTVRSHGSSATRSIVVAR